MALDYVHLKCETCKEFFAPVTSTDTAGICVTGLLLQVCLDQSATTGCISIAHSSDATCRVMHP